jgi:hypothetical protein
LVTCSGAIGFFSLELWLDLDESLVSPEWIDSLDKGQSKGFWKQYGRYNSTPDVVNEPFNLVTNGVLEPSLGSPNRLFFKQVAGKVKANVLEQVVKVPSNLDSHGGVGREEWTIPPLVF